MRIDLSSDDSFFLPDKPLMAGRDDPDAPNFGDLLKDFAEDTLPDETTGQLATVEDGEADNELKLYLALGLDLLEFVEIKTDPGKHQAESAVTAEELIELIETSATEVAEEPLETILPAGTGSSESAQTTQEAETNIPSDKPGPAEAAPADPESTPASVTTKAATALSDLPHPPGPTQAFNHNKETEALDPETIELATRVKKAENAHKQDQAPVAEAARQDPLSQAESPERLQGRPDLSAAFAEPALDANTEDAPGQRSSHEPAQTSQTDSDTPDEQERDLNYEEIQTLVETALDRSRQLPARVQQLLKELLGALAEGQRWLLDQHRLMGLEAGEWQLLTQLFPPHFYAGLLRQQGRTELPLFEILQDLYTQSPPSPERQQQLQALWQPGFGSKPLPRLLQRWILDQAPESSFEELGQLLEHWQQQQTLPPGPIGRTLQLALAYRHHPEKMLNLFELSRSLLHGKALTLEQRNILAQCVSERCFHRELTNQSQIQSLLARTLNGQEPSENELRQLLSGCSQGVLSYLPGPQLHTSLQELQDYVCHDLLGNEDGVLDLIAEANGWHPAGLS